MLLNVPKQPASARVRGFHLQSTVQLDRMADNLVRRQGVVVGISDDYLLSAGGLERSGIAQAHRVFRKIGTEGPKIREPDGLLVRSLSQDLPATLVAHVIV